MKIITGKIKKIRKVECDSNLYDIETAKNHNFFANGILVHNSSWSAYYKLDTDEFGVLGRTMEYKLDCQNNYTAQIARYDIENRLKSYCKKHNVSLCIRGESYGNGIQKGAHNPHSNLPAGLAIFSVYLIDERRYARKGDPFYFPTVCNEMDLPHVQILEQNVKLTEDLIKYYSSDVTYINGQPFEGVVINHGAYTREIQIDNEGFSGKVEYNAPAGSFKIINKNYDAKK